ncbi:MAG: hypothetical protein ACI9HK_004704, partial [Pirellulaceae bacterium]
AEAWLAEAWLAEAWLAEAWLAARSQNTKLKLAIEHRSKYQSPAE